jgi:hypothetical protein
VASTNTAAFIHTRFLVLHLSFSLALHPHLVNPWPPQTETLPIPNVDRGKRYTRDVMAVVTERVHNGYKLGTSGGMLLGSYTRNQLELSDSQFLDKETVDKLIQY